jgi:lysozyme family protein
MADFKQALQLVLKHEGGYGFDKDDPGGETYKGIARNVNSKWEGWVKVDQLKKQTSFPKNLDTDGDLQESVEHFYQTNYWDRVQGDKITSQNIANSIFDFGVNAGVGTSNSLAQMVVDVRPDGVLGATSLAAINNISEELFLASFTIAKISRYMSIVEKRPTSRKYFYGWVRRALGK